jgi:YVTN family beta-propeller protein
MHLRRVPGWWCGIPGTRAGAWWYALLVLVVGSVALAGPPAVGTVTLPRMVGAPIPVGEDPADVAVSPDGRRVYVANNGSNTVSVIDTTSNTVAGEPTKAGEGPIPVGLAPEGVAVSPEGKRLYVANAASDTVSVIDTGSNKVL